MTPPRLLRLSSPWFALLLACGDDVGVTDAASSGDAGSTAGTDDPPTTADVPTSTSTATGGASQTGGLTTGATDDTGLGPTTAPTSGSTSATTADDTTVAGASTTGDTSTSTSADDSGSSSGGDASTGDPPGSCLDADFPVTVPLCGDGGPACALQLDELVSPEPKFRNDMPAIALRGDCGPAVLYSVAVGDYFGFYAERTGPDSWAVEPTPMKVATGSLEAVPAADTMLAAVDDGAFGVSLWRRTGGVWQQETALAGMNHTRAPQLARDGQQRLHLGHIDDAGHLRHDVYDGAWASQQLLDQTEIHVRLGLAPDDTARVIAWSSVGQTWQLFHAAPPAAPELVTDLGSNVLERHHTALALVGADAEPWILLARKQPDQVHHDVLLAHRSGPKTWEFELLAAEDPATDETCAAPPSQPGQICPYDYRRVYTAALVAGAADVRALYSVLHYQGTLVAQCMQNPQPFCFWAPNTDESTGELRVAWPGADPADHQVVATDVFTDRATARLDSAGAVHLAFYDYAATGGDPVVRYLRVGP